MHHRQTNHSKLAFRDKPYYPKMLCLKLFELAKQMYMVSIDAGPIDTEKIILHYILKKRAYRNPILKVVSAIMPSRIVAII